jgi:hypothetical protein
VLAGFAVSAAATTQKATALARQSENKPNILVIFVGDIGQANISAST